MNWLTYWKNRTSGLLDAPSTDRMAKGYVRYPDGYRSIDMPLGNAADYAKIFGGEVFASTKDNR